MKERILVVGGGWAGCGAAVQSAKMGCRTILLERTDMLLGTGLVGGIMRNNGRFTAAEELIFMGGGELLGVIEENLRHKNVCFPGHSHADLYNVPKIAAAVLQYVRAAGVEVIFNCRITKVRKALDRGKEDRLLGVEDGRGRVFWGDGFVDATGTAGPMSNCVRYGTGCAMCALRCPSFGGRVSLSGLAGVEEIVGRRKDGRAGAMSGSCKLMKESLSPALQKELNEKGVAVVPIPKEAVEDHLEMKCCQQYALPSFRDNAVLLDTGPAKLMAPFYDLELLHKIPGLENARYEDPYGGGRGNSIRYLAMAPRDDALKVKGVENLYCAGEKAGLLVGHTEALVTGVLAGYNCVQSLRKMPGLILSRKTACGDAVAYVRERMETGEGLKEKYTFSGSVYFERMKSLGLYTTDREAIEGRVKEQGLWGVFS